jgi:hypothetical protein
METWKGSKGWKGWKGSKGWKGGITLKRVRDVLADLAGTEVNLEVHEQRTACMKEGKVKEGKKEGRNIRARKEGRNLREEGKKEGSS